MKRVCWWIGCVLTFGLLYLWSKRGKKQGNASPKLKFNLAKFFDAVGGKNNITSIKASPATLKVNLKDVNSVNKDAIKKIWNKGTIIASNSLTLLCGSESEAIARMIQAQLG